MKTKIQLARESAFKDVLAEQKSKTVGRKAIDKKSVTFHTKDAGDSGTGGSGTSGGVRAPTDDELTIINRFTGSPKTADEIAVFETLSANSLPDRDDDYFTRDTIKGFASLEEPFGPVGKSYMTGHDYSGMPVGRIFEVDTKTVKIEGFKDEEGKDPLFLTNKIYVPNTDQYKSMLENIDFGINWAVSVGVMLEAHTCSICDNDMYWFFCAEGHVKGEYYDPSSDEVDSWGWPIPVDAGAKGAVKMLGVMKGAKDFYELSQVFLGAQYFAALDSTKGKAVKGVVKSAERSESPFVGLSALEAKELPFQHTDERVVKALQSYTVEYDDDGTMKWVDEDSLMWTFSPGNDVLCLGKKAEDDTSEDETSDATEEEVNKDGEGDLPAEGGGQELRREGAEVESVEPDDESERDERVGEDEVGSDADSDVEGEDGQVDDPDDTDDTDDSEEDGVSRSALLAAAKRAQAPTAILSAIAEAGDDKGALDAVLLTVSDHVKGLESQVNLLTPKAAMGEEFLKTLTADAIDWYVKAHQTGDSTKGVDTGTFERVLAACGDDTELIKSLTQEQKELAQSKFPTVVRRSSAPTDPNVATIPEPLRGAEEAARSDKADKRVRRLHG